MTEIVANKSHHILFMDGPLAGQVRVFSELLMTYTTNLLVPIDLSQDANEVIVPEYYHYFLHEIAAGYFVYTPASMSRKDVLNRLFQSYIKEVQK